MANHVGEFLSVHDGLIAFTQYGLEKYKILPLNITSVPLIIKDHRHFTDQQKQNRIEHLHDSGLCSHKKFVIKCGNCRQEELA